MLKSTFFFLTLFLLGLFLIPPSPVFADEASGNLELYVNGYHVRLKFSPPARAGENEFHVYLQDLDNTPLTSIRVNLMAAPLAQTDEDAASIEKNPALAGHYILHSIQELPIAASANSIDWFGNLAADPNAEGPFEHPADHIVLALRPGQNAGESSGVVSFPQTGRWILIVGFTARDKTQFAQFPLKVADKPESPAGIFVGVLAAGAILIYGVTLIRRKAK